MSNLVVYKDEMNTVALRNSNSTEMDLFFCICSQMRDKDSNKITFDFEDLKKLSDYKVTATKRFIGDLEGVYTKLIQLDYRIETEERITKFVLFTQYEIDKGAKTIAITVNEPFKYILNNISRNFTKFELEEFTMLNSAYSKTAYRLLKQFRTTGYYVAKIDEFRRLFDVPESYEMCNITQRILEPIEKELSQYFKNLEITKVKGKGKRRRNVEYIEFKFEPERDIKEGKKTFRDKETGEYYERDMMDFDEGEINKTFPEAKVESRISEVKNEMGLSKENYTERQIHTLFQIALDKVLQSNSKVDVFECIRLCNEYARKQDDVKNKYNYLVATITNDYGENLEKRYSR